MLAQIPDGLGFWATFDAKIYNWKLDGVGPVDNRPSTDYLRPIVIFFITKKLKNLKKKNVWVVTRDTYSEMNILS